jgi:entericidin A
MHSEPFVKRIISLLLLACFCAAVLSGCNTVKGIGKDVKKVGETVEKAGD